VPLLGFVEEILAQLCAIIDPRYRFEFIGLHQEEAQFKNERVKLSSTINELREIDGKEPLPDEMLGNAPSNPALMQVYMAELQQAQAQQQQQEQPGEPGAGGDEEYPENPAGEHAPYTDTAGSRRPRTTFTRSTWAATKTCKRRCAGWLCARWRNPSVTSWS